MADKKTKKAMTLVEVLIVVAILGILAAITLPHFRTHTAKANEASSKDNLRILRNAIMIYAAKNNDVAPGYPANNPTLAPGYVSFLMQLKIGGYLSDLPENPFNGLAMVQVLKNGDVFPAEPTGTTGWMYQPATKTIKLNSVGTDSTGMEYFDY